MLVQTHPQAHYLNGEVITLVNVLVEPAQYQFRGVMYTILGGHLCYVVTCN